MEFFNNLWKNIESLRSLSGFLQWFSIILIFIGGFLQIAKQIVDRREKNLTNALVEEKDSLRTEQEQSLNAKVSDLEGELDSKDEEISDLKEKAKYSNPFEQPIHSGSAKVTVTIKNTNNINSHFMDRGAYIAFGKGSKPTLVMNSIDSFGKSIGNDAATYTANLSLDANDVSIGKIVRSLKETEFIQVGFAAIPEKSIIIGGNIICTINGIVRFEINIPGQQMAKDFMIANNLENAFKDFQ